jgi:hypothetical protein
MTETKWEEVKIEHGIPVPDYTEGIIRKLLEKLDLGASMAVESADPALDAHLVRKVAARIGVKVIVLTVPLENGSSGLRVWYAGYAVAGGRKASEQTMAFLTAACDAVTGAETEAGVIVEAYLNWCDENGLQPAKRNSFARDLTRAGYPLNGQNTHRLGLRLKPENTFNSNEIIA